MMLAVLMESRLTKAKGVWKVIMYIPALTSVVISGMLFRLMFSEGDNGQMNQLMHLLGNASIPWLKEKTTGWIALLLLCMWRWTGVNMLYFISGLKSIDTSLYESADIDGANAKQKFWYVTLPLLKPTTIYVITISVYAGLSMFLESFMLWNGNSSPKNIGLTIVGYLYKRGIEKNDMGYACAVGMVLLVIALAINVVQLVATGTFKKEEKFSLDFPPVFILFIPSPVLFGPPTTCTSFVFLLLVGGHTFHLHTLKRKCRSSPVDI